jgi:predicted ATP-binding protein involved in virulence
MELIYLWIETYLNIRKCGFKFSNRVQIDETIDEDKRTFTLNIGKNENYIEHFFGTNILNVSGIIGANGVGKSNLLNYVKDFLASHGSYDDKWVAVFYDYKAKHMAITDSLSVPDSKSKRWKIILKNKSDYKHVTQHASLEFNPVSQNDRGLSVPGLNSRVIFYSPLLDLRDYPEFKGFEGLYVDISTNYLLYADSKNMSRDRDILEVYRYKNIERQFLFVQKNQSFLKEIRFPTEIEIMFIKTEKLELSDLGLMTREFYEQFRNRTTELWNIGPNALIREGKEKSSRELIEEGRKWKYKMWFAVNLVGNFLDNLSLFKDLDDKYFKVNNVDQTFDFKKQDAFSLARSFFSIQTFISSDSFDFSAFIELIFRIIDTEANVLGTREENECIFYVSAVNAQLIWQNHTRYLNAFKKESGTKGFLELNWRDISSGEKALIDLFSRIEYGLERLRDKGLKKESLYIILDEGEAGFHPKWQKAYLSLLLQYLQTIKTNPIYIILSTHSPFIVSDIPAENLLLLRKGNDGECVIQKQLTSFSQTFGANIHSLLADSFFLDNGVIGDFAYAKITKLFEYNESDALKNKVEFKKVINMIGEPLLRIKLSEIYAEKLGNEYEKERLEKEIQLMQQQLTKLSTKDNDSNS